MHPSEVDLLNPEPPGQTLQTLTWDHYIPEATPPPGSEIPRTHTLGPSHLRGHINKRIKALGLGNRAAEDYNDYNGIKVKKGLRGFWFSGFRLKPYTARRFGPNRDSCRPHAMRKHRRRTHKLCALNGAQTDIEYAMTCPRVQVQSSKISSLHFVCRRRVCSLRAPVDLPAAPRLLACLSRGRCRCEIYLYCQGLRLRVLV